MVIFTTLILLLQLIFSPLAYSAAIEGKEEGVRVSYCKSIDFVGGSQTLTNAGLDCTLTSTAITSSPVEDDAYGAGWDNDTTNAPSQNALYDIMSLWDTDGDGDIDSVDGAVGGGDITGVGPGGTAAGDALTDGYVTSGTSLFVWEGTTDDDNEYTLIIPEDPASDINVTLPIATGTITTTADKLSVFAATTSAELSTVLSDEDGTGACSANVYCIGGHSHEINNILDATAATTIGFDNDEVITLNTAEDTGSFLTIANSDADLAGATYLIDLTYVDDGSAYGYYIRARDDTGGSANTVFSVGGDGAINTDAGITALGTIEGATITEGGIAVLNNDEMDASSELLNIFDDETGTGVIVFGTSPTFTTSILAASQADIGSTTAEFGDIFIGDGKAIKFGDDQDVTLTHVADTGLLLNLELEVDGTLDADGIVALGDGGDNFSVDSDVLDISTAGVISGATGITSTGTIDFGGADDLEIPNGAGPTVDTAGQVGIDTTSDQYIYYGGAKRVLTYKYEESITVENIAAADDSVPFGSKSYARTVTQVGCRCIGTCTTKAEFSFSDSAANAFTLAATPTCATTGAATYQNVTAGGALVAGEGMLFNVTNAVSPETDWYEIMWVETVTAD